MFLPAESHGQRSLARYSPWGCQESDTTEWLTLIREFCECRHAELNTAFWNVNCTIFIPVALQLKKMKAGSCSTFPSFSQSLCRRMTVNLVVIVNLVTLESNSYRRCSSTTKLCFILFHDNSFFDCTTALQLLLVFMSSFLRVLFSILIVTWMYRKTRSGHNFHLRYSSKVYDPGLSLNTKS